MFKKSDHDTNNIPADARLDERLQHLRDQINAPPKLKGAAKTGIPLSPREKYGTAVHVRHFTKAVLAYSLGVCLLIGTVLVVPSLFSGSNLAGSSIPGGLTDGSMLDLPDVTTDEGALDDAETTTAPNDRTPTDPSQVKEVPYCGEALAELLEGKTNLNVTGKVDLRSIHSTGINLWHPNTNALAKLFDNQSSSTCDAPEKHEVCAGGHFADVSKKSGGAYIYFSLTERQTVESYVITPACDNYIYIGRNPIEWTLYATNDPSLPVEEWTVLDYVWDGGIDLDSTAAAGYVVDSDRQDAYQHYCWNVNYTTLSDALNVAEFALYTG